MYYLILALVTLCFFEGRPQLPVDRPTRRWLERRVLELGADDFDHRQRAERRLREQGGLAHATLILHEDSEDAEIALRVRRLLGGSFYARSSRKTWAGVVPRLHALCGGDVAYRQVTETHFHPWARTGTYQGRYLGSWGQLPPSGDTLDWCYARGVEVLTDRSVPEVEYSLSLHALDAGVQQEASRRWFRELRRQGWSRRGVGLLIDALTWVEDGRTDR